MSSTVVVENSSYIVGYLAFARTDARVDHNNVHQLELDNQPELGIVEHHCKERIHQREQSRKKRVELEDEEAMKGEIEWVKSGGTLRDKAGKRDFVRTTMIRKELDAQEREKTALERWTAYETRWNALLASPGPLSFTSIPWPVQHQARSLHDIIPGKISEFVAATLHTRQLNTTRKDRIRHLILRFHPDKSLNILSRVADEDMEDVKGGFYATFMALKGLQVEPVDH